VVGCVKEGALGAMDRALTMDAVALVEGVVTLERNPRYLLDASDELDLPVDREARDHRLDELLWRRATSLLESSSLRIQLPTKQTFEGEFFLTLYFSSQRSLYCKIFLKFFSRNFYYLILAPPISHKYISIVLMGRLRYLLGKHFKPPTITRLYKLQMYENFIILACVSLFVACKKSKVNKTREKCAHCAREQKCEGENVETFI
jgi:hypothetical protein